MSGSNNYTSEITDCYNIGEIFSDDTVGGIVGMIYASSNNIKYCYNIGTIEGMGSSRKKGSIVGYKWDGIIENCYYSNTSGIKAIQNQDDEANNVYALENEYMKSTEFVDLLNSGNDENIWKLETDIYRYPVLKWQKDAVVVLKSIEITTRTK